jgi:hypothetical protein
VYRSNRYGVSVPCGVDQVWWTFYRHSDEAERVRKHADSILTPETDVVLSSFTTLFVSNWWIFLLVSSGMYQFLKILCHYLLIQFLVSMLVFWAITPCWLVGKHQRFKWTYYLSPQPWRWRQCVPPKRWYILTSPRGVTAQMTKHDFFPEVPVSLKLFRVERV